MFSVFCQIVVNLILFSYADDKASAMYQDLPNNINGKSISSRSVTVLVRDSPPFSYQLSDETFGGIEIKLLEEIATELNLKIEYIFNNGDIAINHKSIERRIDVVIGGVPYGMTNKFRTFSPTSPYYRDDMTWCVKNADQIPLWLNIFAVFKNFDVAITLTLLFFVCVVLFFAQTAFERKPLNLVTALIVSYNLLFCFGISYPAKRNSTRFIVLYYVLASMLVAIHYTSYYTAFMITPRLGNQVSTIEELIEGHFKIAGGSDTILQLEKSEKVPIDLLNRYETCTNLDKCLHRLITDERLAVAVSRQRAINNREQHMSHLYCFDETQNINTYFVAMYVNNDYFASDQIHKLTQRFFESGFFQKWTMDTNINHFKMNNQTVKKISMDHLLGAFFGCSFTFTWAVIQFILEILAHKRARRPNARRIWILLDRFQDNERHEWNFADGRNNGKKLSKSIVFTSTTALILLIYSIYQYFP